MFLVLLLTFASYPVFSAGDTCGTKPDLYCKSANLEQDINNLKTKQETRVVYSAYGFEILGTNVTFPNVIMNNGSGYNSTTGQFKAPVAGMYYIAATLSTAQEKEYQRVQCFIQRNGDSIVELFSDKFGTDEVGSYQLTATEPVYLAIGDVVGVGGCISYEGIHNDRGTSFKGILIQAD
ncbi:complement C1q tumor necrosis factor-related protein 5-like [Mercenaria mercenaria]|uniref:complement C1q tumor necrosis factor-related protein 5-like n=1 Tax=Mercenaria mercenaria TaxID=6596 RepID=UPI001E1DD554|nr:complement C1q tumor necrosis factor-related protein 5-like [Mercenaria mercenaria]